MRFRDDVEMMHLELFPDRSVDNKGVHNMIRAVSSFYASPLDVWRGKKEKGFIWWDIWMGREGIRFILTIPRSWKKEMLLHIENTWPLCAVEEVKPPVISDSADVCEMKYRRSNLFALQTDRRLEYEPLRSILSITSEMEPGDNARLSLCVEPISRLDWQDWSEAKYKEFKQGETPKRSRLSKKDLLISAGEAVTGLLQSVLDMAHMATGEEEPKKTKSDDLEKRIIMIDGNLSKGTLNKLKAPTFNTYIRIAASSPDPQRQKIIMRAVSNSFNELTADNELEREDFHSRVKPIVIKELTSYSLSYLTKLDWDKNRMSNEELGRLIEMPTAALQDEFKELIQSMDTRQIEVPATVTKGGLPLGTVTFKKQDVTVYMPTNDWDQLCLPTGVIGGMGVGKTTFAVQRGVRFVESGFSSVIVDPKKSEVWEGVSKQLPKEKRRRILLGEDVISFDFREALRTKSGRSRLAQIVLTFFQDNTDPAGAQTQRFLRSAVMAMQTGKLREVLKILTDDAYRKQVMGKLADGMHKQTMVEFDAYKPDRQRQILAPVMNRLDLLLGDSYLAECMESDKGLDMVDVLSQKEMCTVFDVPDRMNTRFAKDILINLISFKIDAAMGLRQNLFPVAIIFDEPHQYLRSASLWESVAVEARAYRLAYHWLFHSWEQIPDKLAQIVKDAGPHFILFQSSKKTYTGLKEEIAPFTVEDGLNTKRYHAICALKVGDNRLTPFLCKMGTSL